MITTRILYHWEYTEYAGWLKSQDSETLRLYFGVEVKPEFIDRLVERITANPGRNYFIVAEYNHIWAGTIHIAIDQDTVEFGIIVREDQRGQSIGSRLIEEALVWARNRGYRRLFMHCIQQNSAIQHLCRRHNLPYKNMYGDVEVEIELEPADLQSFTKEISIIQRNIFQKFVKRCQLV